MSILMATTRNHASVRQEAGQASTLVQHGRVQDIRLVHLDPAFDDTFKKL